MKQTDFSQCGQEMMSIPCFASTVATVDKPIIFYALLTKAL